MFISIRGRVLINVEALNMTESVGNYVKHRKVPVVLPEFNYATYFVPAISGETIAHGYQEKLAEIASKKKLSVCKYCNLGIFLKSTDKEVFKESFGINPPKSEKDIEETIIRNCTVEDIGGFLYAEAPNVNRTSSFFVGYMIPVKESIESVVIESQLHSRYALGTKFVKKRGERRGQMIYYVEISSAPYVFSFDFDSRFVGKYTFVVDEKARNNSIVSNDERRKRIEAALDSIKELLVETCFGAKKTRFLPIISWESIAIAVSKDGVFTVPSSFSVNYIENSINKLDKYNKGTKLFVYINPEVLEDTSEYIKKTTKELIDSFYKYAEEFEKCLKEKDPEAKVDFKKIIRERLESFFERKIEELAASSDLRYVSTIKKKYLKAKEMLEKKGIKVYDKFEECLKDAIEEAKGVYSNDKRLD